MRGLSSIALLACGIAGHAAAQTGTKSLVLGHTPADAYHRRGQARYYAGKFDAAADDFAKSAADRSEPGEKRMR